MSNQVVIKPKEATKTTVVFSAVVFLLCLLFSGCQTGDGKSSSPPSYRNTQSQSSSVPVRRRKRQGRQAHEYSRISGSYPASWQMSSIGN